MTLTEIKQKVRTIMNETGEDEHLSMLSEDTVRLDDYIASALPSAVQSVLLSAPLRCLNASSVSVAVEEVDGVGVISLPEDFLRLAAVRLKEWKRTVYIAYEGGSEEHKVQSNPVTRSGVNKPCCALAHNGKGPVLECFPTGTLSFFRYVRSAESDTTGDGLGQLKPILHPAVCYMCASLVYDTFEMQSIADRMKQIAVSLIPES